MKKTKYFNSVEEAEQYYGSLNNIPSGDLVVVVGENEQVLFSTSNNLSASGQMQDMGGYNIDADDREKIDYSYTGVVDYYSNGASMSYVADYVSTYGGGEAPDMSAYATTSYVVENYFPKSGGDVSGNITLTNNVAYLNTQPLDIKFQKDGGNQTFEFNFKTNTGGTSTVNIGNSGKGWIEQWSIAAMNNKVKTDHFTYTYFKGDIFAKGIGNFDGTNQANAYTLAYVINEIQTTLGTANSLAELIIGQE